VLVYRTQFASPIGRAQVQDYRFAPIDRIAVVVSINANLEVSSLTLDQGDVHEADIALIREHMPLLHFQNNPRALPELAALRAQCRAIAADPSLQGERRRSVVHGGAAPLDVRGRWLWCILGHHHPAGDGFAWPKLLATSPRL
jgi:hypothetical protein